MIEPENEQGFSEGEKFDSLMKSFFEGELPSARLQHREIATIETNRISDSSTRRILVLVVTALSLLVMANIFWHTRLDETPPSGDAVKTNPDRVSPTPVSRPHITRIPRIQNRQETVILPEGQEFGMNFSQVDIRREHVDSKTGTKLNITFEEFQIEIYEIPKKGTKSKPKTSTNKPLIETETKKKVSPKKSPVHRTSPENKTILP